MGLWFKVLIDGKSCHGGSQQWSLPTVDAPGDWHELPAGIAPLACDRGFHLTQEPATWWKPGAKFYIAEGGGATSGDTNKTAFARARLLREATEDELVEAWVFVGQRNGVVPAGKTGLALESSRVVARESSRVVARESSRVVAWESSSVEAWGSSRVEAWGSSSVVAWESSRVEACGSSSVVAWGSSRVEAWGSSSVVARESSRVVARGSSRVEAWGSSSVEGSGQSITSRPAPECKCPACTNKSTVKVTERAVLVDQTGDAPIVTTAAGELAVVVKSKPAKAKARKRKTKVSK